MAACFVSVQRRTLLRARDGFGNHSWIMSALRTLFLSTVGVLSLALATPAMAHGHGWHGGGYGWHGNRGWHGYRHSRVIIVNPAPVYQYRPYIYPYYSGYYPYYRRNVVIVRGHHPHHHYYYHR